jgi:hypothetical protein
MFVTHLIALTSRVDGTLVDGLYLSLALPLCAHAPAMCVFAVCTSVILAAFPGIREVPEHFPLVALAKEGLPRRSESFIENNSPLMFRSSLWHSIAAGCAYSHTHNRR